MIFLRPALKKAHPDLTRFITAHEAAHLARDDSMSDALAAACLATLVSVAAVTSRLDIWWLYIPTYALLVTLKWSRELACDRIAACAAGQFPASEYIAHLGRADNRRRRLPLRPRVRAQIRSRLTHPPTRMRRNAIARSARRATPHPANGRQAA